MLSAPSLILKALHHMEGIIMTWEGQRQRCLQGPKRDTPRSFAADQLTPTVSSTTAFKRYAKKVNQPFLLWRFMSGQLVKERKNRCVLRQAGKNTNESDHQGII